jgi:hypothetical protein
MLSMVWAKSLEWSKWSYNNYNDNNIEGAITISIFISGGKKPPHIENDVLGGWRSSIASHELCGIVPLETYS